MDLSQARALVTGGSSGIGLAIARALRERGAAVAICARGRDRLEAAAAEIGAVAIAADVADEDSVVSLVADARRLLGGLDVVVNNAAYGAFRPLLELDRDAFEQLLATNVVGAMLVAREAARVFVEAGGGGNIVNVASTAGQRGFAGGTAYVASKFALSGMTECWRAELRKHGVRVMQINPSEVQTEFAAVAGYDQQASERKLFPEDIAHVVLAMLELPDRGFVTEATVWATNPP